MNRLARVMLIAGVLGAGVVACSDQERDTAVNVADDDPEMLAAIAEARRTLPGFWAVFEKAEPGDSDFALKVRVAHRTGAEHLWVTDIARRDGKILGTINNDPTVVASVKLGDRIEILESDISDWTYLRNGKIVGNRTIRVLFKQMPATEVERIKRMLADP